jgi:hypothetical protein
MGNKKIDGTWREGKHFKKKNGVWVSGTKFKKIAGVWYRGGEDTLLNLFWEGYAPRFAEYKAWNSSGEFGGSVSNIPSRNTKGTLNDWSKTHAFEIELSWYAPNKFNYYLMLIKLKFAAPEWKQKFISENNIKIGYPNTYESYLYLRIGTAPGPNDDNEYTGVFNDISATEIEFEIKAHERSGLYHTIAFEETTSMGEHPFYWGAFNFKLYPRE